jgi:hypothetical protein
MIRNRHHRPCYRYGMPLLKRAKPSYVIRNSNDAFARACAWTLLDRVTPPNDVEQLREEFEKVIGGDQR